MTHTVENCPGYNPEMIPDVIAAAEQIEIVAKELNIKVHFLVNGLPEHRDFALVEAEDSFALAGFVTASSSLETRC